MNKSKVYIILISTVTALQLETSRLDAFSYTLAFAFHLDARFKVDFSYDISYFWNETWK